MAVPLNRWPTQAVAKVAFSPMPELLVPRQFVATVALSPIPDALLLEPLQLVAMPSTSIPSWVPLTAVLIPVQPMAPWVTDIPVDAELLP